MTIKDILHIATQHLKKKEIDNPRLTAEVLLAFLLNLRREELYMNYGMKLNKKEIKDYCSLIKRRVKGEPIQYITGKKEFWSLEFFVTPSVLIPRPETEVLVENAISCLKRIKNPYVLDLGTGSGVIAITIAKEVPGARIWASDISEEAIKVAIKNAKKHGVFNKIQFLVGDLWEPFRHQAIKFHLIATNPPYIPEEDYNCLPQEIRDWEPRIALNGGAKGITLIKRIIKGAEFFLLHGGWILMETSPEQIQPSIELLKETGNFYDIEGINDYSHQFRVVKARRI